MRISKLACLFISVICSANAYATVITATYQISATNFMDSNSDPPPVPTSAVIGGSYQFTFDTDYPTQLGIIPDQVIGLQITDNTGSIIGFDETDSGVNTSVNIFTNIADITIGGTLDSVASMVGVSNDFTTRFRISLIDYEVTSILEDLGFVTTVDPYYQGPTAISLVSYAIIPEPTTAVLIGLGLLCIVGARKRI